MQSLESPRLAAASCPLCHEDDALPAAVGEDFAERRSAETFIAMRCRRCGVLYLDPRPQLSHDDAPEWGPLRSILNHAVRTIPGAPNATAVVVGGCDADLTGELRARGYLDVRAVGEDAVAEMPERSVDLAILAGTLERATNPGGLLSDVQRVLRPGGCAVIVVANAGSAERAVFGGRHWSGYRFPRRYTFFDRGALATLVARAGLHVLRLRSTAHGASWLDSLQNVANDYGRTRTANEKFRERPWMLRIAAGVDRAASVFDRGALLVAIAERP